ncbi:MAG: V-type ATP synthase subunit D [Thermodesulfovibrionales bacterium]|nr:V-type ATP synthase subunit D [Thermodesulfovibrionales bacterium]
MAIIHPTRTNLLILREKATSVRNSISILKARRQALMREFLETAIPLLRSREEIRKTYGDAIAQLSLSKGHEGQEVINSISLITDKTISVELKEKSLWGLKYKELSYAESPLKMPEDRPYDHFSLTDHLEHSVEGFEKIVEAILEIANFESKTKRLGEEILKTTRRIRVLEERILPDLNKKIREIENYIAEREREAFYRLKLFKGLA